MNAIVDGRRLRATTRTSAAMTAAAARIAVIRPRGGRRAWRARSVAAMDDHMRVRRASPSAGRTWSAGRWRETNLAASSGSGRRGPSSRLSALARRRFTAASDQPVCSTISSSEYSSTRRRISTTRSLVGNVSMIWYTAESSAATSGGAVFAISTSSWMGSCRRSPQRASIRRRRIVAMVVPVTMVASHEAKAWGRVSLDSEANATVKLSWMTSLSSVSRPRRRYARPLTRPTCRRNNASFAAMSPACAAVTSAVGRTHLESASHRQSWGFDESRGQGNQGSLASARAERAR